MIIYTAPDYVGASQISKQTCLIFTIPRLAASDGSLTSSQPRFHSYFFIFLFCFSVQNTMQARTASQTTVSVLHIYCFPWFDLRDHVPVDHYCGIVTTTTTTTGYVCGPVFWTNYLVCTFRGLYCLKSVEFFRSVVSHVFKNGIIVLCAANLRNSTRREVSKRTVQGTTRAVEARNLSGRWRNKNCFKEEEDDCWGVERLKVLWFALRRREWKKLGGWARVCWCYHLCLVEDRSCQTQVKGSVTSCDLGINPHFFTTPVDSLKAKRQRGPLDDDIVPKKGLGEEKRLRF